MFSLSPGEAYPCEAYLSDAVSIELSLDAARALPFEQQCLSPSGEAYSSDTVSIKLLSNVARASRLRNLAFRHPTAGEAYLSDAVSIELPSDAVRALPLHLVISW